MKKFIRAINWIEVFKFILFFIGMLIFVVVGSWLCKDLPLDF